MIEKINKDDGRENLAAEAWRDVAETTPVRLDVKSLDFSGVQETYKKKADIAKAITPEFPTEETIVSTDFNRENGSVYNETVNTAYPGDAIITGAQGERYVLGAETFAKMYEQAKDEDGRLVEGKFVAKNVVKAIKNPIEGGIIIDAPWGGEQAGEADCFVVESQINGDRYIIESKAFADSYELAAE